MQKISQRYRQKYIKRAKRSNLSELNFQYRIYFSAQGAFREIGNALDVIVVAKHKLYQSVKHYVFFRSFHKIIVLVIFKVLDQDNLQQIMLTKPSQCKRHLGLYNKSIRNLSKDVSIPFTVMI